MTMRLLTPTYAPDLQRFRLLRESLLAAGCPLPHLAVVQTEDLPLFQRAGFDERVELLASAEVLPGPVDRLRQRVHARPKWLRKLRRSLNKRSGWCADASYEGWSVQQIVKLQLAARADAELTLTLDSDVIACAPWEGSAYVRDGRIALQTQIREDTLQPHWIAAAGRLLGLPERSQPTWEYLAHPFSFSGERVRALIAHLERRHDAPWWQTLLAQRAGDFSEFTVYGRFVREVGQLQGCFEAPANAHTRWVFTAEDRARVDQLIDQSFASADCRFMVLQADHRHPVDAHAQRLRRHFQQLAARPAGG
ncbi:MAG TPA: DUF6492 family protein [Nevskiaceae bacterium]|nr:DUF6492 family protein [Nevskiaceae bacterium]